VLESGLAIGFSAEVRPPDRPIGEFAF